MSLWDLLLQRQLVLFLPRKLKARASSPSGWEIYFTNPGVYKALWRESESVSGLGRFHRRARKNAQ